MPKLKELDKNLTEGVVFLAIIIILLGFFQNFFEKTILLVCVVILLWGMAFLFGCLFIVWSAKLIIFKTEEEMKK